jgi:glycosyltransferase involved in cell wall biosynthesis
VKLNFNAPLNLSTSYGGLSLNIFSQLESLGVKCVLWPIGGLECQQELRNSVQNALNRQLEYSKNDPTLRIYHQFSLAERPAGNPTFGFPIFELRQFTPQEKVHLNSVDHLLVASAWGKEVIGDNGINVPVTVVPLGVDRTIFHEGVPTSRLGEIVNNTTIFLNIAKWEVRKGHDILPEVFRMAFSPTDNVKLVMHPHNPFIGDENKRWQDYYKSILGDQVIFTPGRFGSTQDMARLIADSDCGLYPSRAEGWGLPELETLSMGKWLIGTNYAGHTEFLNNENSLLTTPEGYEPAHDKPWFYGQGEWAKLSQDNLDELVNYMRLVHKMKQDGQLKLNTHGVETAKRLSWQNTANIIREALVGGKNSVS